MKLSAVGGCFWGVELAFQRVPGVTDTSVGYTQGRDPTPTYEAVCSGGTGHTEAVQVAAASSQAQAQAVLHTLIKYQLIVTSCKPDHEWMLICCTPAYIRHCACSVSSSSTATVMVWAVLQTLIWGLLRLQVNYNPSECSYESLLDCFLEHVDPTTKNRQGMDMGTQYRSGIFYHNDTQKQAAEKVYHRLCFFLGSSNAARPDFQVDVLQKTWWIMS